MMQNWLLKYLLVLPLSFQFFTANSNYYELWLENAFLPILGEGSNGNAFLPGKRISIEAAESIYDSVSNKIYFFDQWVGINTLVPIYYNGLPFVEDAYDRQTIVFMPRNNIAVKALYREQNTFKLQLKDAIPEIRFVKPGTLVEIQAHLTELGKVFSYWKWSNDSSNLPLDSIIASQYQATTHIIMPYFDVALDAVYSNNLADTSLHELRVDKAWIVPNGILSIDATHSTAIVKSNQIVKIIAFDPDQNSVFEKWQAIPEYDIQFLDDENSPTTYLRVPDASKEKYLLHYSALYKPISDIYTLKIIDGITSSGASSAYFNSKDTIVIAAVSPAINQIFSSWLVLDYNSQDTLPASQIKIADPKASTTYLIMPSKSIIIKAVFEYFEFPEEEIHIRENHDHPDWQILPVVSDGNISFKSNSTINESYIIINQFGSILLNSKCIHNHECINLSFLPSGIYFMKFNGTTKKFIISK